MDLPRLQGEGVTLRQIDRDDLKRLTEIILMPGVREWWGPSIDTLGEDLFQDGGAWVVEVDGETAGWLGVFEEVEPGYRNAAFDIMLAPAYQGRGLGPNALRTAARWLAGERGHHRFTIDPAAHNERAISAYRAAGFKPVGVMRRYEQGSDGSWHDSLLMDLLAEELT